MNSYIEKASAAARHAAQAKDWPTVKACARDILNRRRDSPEGHFLMGLFEKASDKPERAIKAFSMAIKLDKDRYDAAIELASQFLRLHRYSEAVTLLQQHGSQLENSPRYLEIAATIYMNVGLPERAWPLYQQADRLQPGVDSLRAKLAECSVYVGKTDEAVSIYRQLLEKFPDHQRNHYELSRIQRATDDEHVKQMLAIVRSTERPPGHNIYIHYAIGKELEDLERWDEAFEHFKMAGDAAASVADYDVRSDIDVIDSIIDTCNSDWFADGHDTGETATPEKTPIFVVGLPRTGTTLTERILSSHSKVESAGESYFIQIVLGQISGIKDSQGMSPAIVRAAATKDSRRIADAYRKAIAYKLGDKPFFIDKFPENFSYLGFIAKAFPDCRIVYLNRNPMDACFALYKQSFFRYAYTLDDLGRYYLAYHRLHEHWRQVLGNRLIEVDYEELVSDQENQTRKLLEGIGLDFEETCIDFEKNRSASNTASSAQIREKMHTRSVHRWRRFEKQLDPLKKLLEDAGVEVAAS